MEIEENFLLLSGSCVFSIPVVVGQLRGRGLEYISQSFPAQLLSFYLHYILYGLVSFLFLNRGLPCDVLGSLSSSHFH